MAPGAVEIYVLRFDRVEAPAVISPFSLGADLSLAKREAERKFHRSAVSLTGVTLLLNWHIVDVFDGQRWLSEGVGSGLRAGQDDAPRTAGMMRANVVAHSRAASSSTSRKDHVTVGGHSASVVI
jgi:hypothetical protein